MPKTSLGLVLIFVSLLSWGCTTTRWMVESQNAVDPSDVDVVSKDYFLNRIGEVTPQEPYLKVELLSRNRYVYAEKVLLERYIQDYKLRWPFFILSLAAGGFTIYSAQSDLVVEDLSTSEQNIITGAGGLIALSGMLHMKPSGELRATGEKRYLRQTGTQEVIDTVRVAEGPSDSLRYSIYYDNQRLAFKQKAFFDNGIAQIPLGQYFRELSITRMNPGEVLVAVNYRDQIYDYQVSVASFMKRFVEITIPSAPLRVTPEWQEESVITNLGKGSRLPLIERVEDNWYKVMYGIRESYVSSNNSQVVWYLDESNTSDSENSQLRRIVQVQEVEYGEIDVESNLPILAARDSLSMGIIIANEQYRSSLSSRQYALRDARLVNDYFTSSLGIPSENLFRYDDLENQANWDDFKRNFTAFEDTLNQKLVYINGYGKVNQHDRAGDSLSYSLLLTEWRDGKGEQVNAELSLQELFQSVLQIPSQSTTLFLDLDYIAADSTVTAGPEAIAQEFQQQINTLMDTRFGNISIISANRPGMPSRTYYKSGVEDQKHSVFCYYLAEALQQKITEINPLFQFLERNVTYTARRLFDQPQNPQRYGTSMNRLTP